MSHSLLQGTLAGLLSSPLKISRVTKPQFYAIWEILNWKLQYFVQRSLRPCLFNFYSNKNLQILEKILKECFTDNANSVEVYSEPNQTSKMEFFVKIGNAFNLFAIFVKKFHFIIWVGLTLNTETCNHLCRCFVMLSKLVSDLSTNETVWNTLKKKGVFAITFPRNVICFLLTEYKKLWFRKFLDLTPNEWKSEMESV